MVLRTKPILAQSLARSLVRIPKIYGIKQSITTQGEMFIDQVWEKPKPLCGRCLIKRKVESKAMTEDVQNEENSRNTSWENRRDHIPRQTKRIFRKKKKLTQVTQPADTQRNLPHHCRRESKARVRQILVGNPACVKTLKPALTAR